MSLKSAFKTDALKENEGVEIPFPMAENEDGTIPTFLVSRMGKNNKAYQKSLEVITRPYRRQLDTGTIKPDVSRKIFMEVFCDSILKGWSNVRNEDGSEIVFSKAAAIELMEELPDLYDVLVYESQELANFRQAALENEAKN